MFRLMLRRQLVFSISDLHVQCVLRVLNVKYMINTCSKSALCEIKGRVVARLLIYWPNQTRCCQAANDLLTIVRVINNPSLMFNARNSDKLYLALFSVMRHNTKTFVLSLPRSQWCSAKSAVPRRHHITSPMVITTPQTVCYRDAIAGMTHKVAPLHHDHEVSGHFSSNIRPSQTLLLDTFRFVIRGKHKFILCTWRKRIC